MYSIKYIVSVLKSMNYVLRCAKDKYCIRLVEDLVPHDINFITSRTAIDSTERLLCVYLAISYNFGWINSSDTLVILTDTRLISYQNSTVSNTSLSQVALVQHEHNLIAWDNIELLLHDGSTRKVAVYDSKSCSYLVDFVNSLLK